jgi:hypothetical protein
MLVGMYAMAGFLTLADEVLLSALPAACSACALAAARS